MAMREIVDTDYDEFITFEDGFQYYWPLKSGGFSAHQLREIADELDRRNAVWDKQLREELARLDDGLADSLEFDK